MFWYTLLGLVVSFVAVQALGLWGASVLTDQTAGGVSELLGGGVAGRLRAARRGAGRAVQQRDERLQRFAGPADRRGTDPAPARPPRSRPRSASRSCCGCTRRTPPRASRTCCCSSATGSPASSRSSSSTGARGPGHGAVRRSTSPPSPPGAAGWPALLAFVAAFAAAVPFMDTSLYVGPVADALHGADLSYYVAFLVALTVYAPLRRLRPRH